MGAAVLVAGGRGGGAGVAAGLSQGLEGPPLLLMEEPHSESGTQVALKQHFVACPHSPS